jgi:hypothetical protein
MTKELRDCGILLRDFAQPEVEQGRQIRLFPRISG